MSDRIISPKGVEWRVGERVGYGPIAEKVSYDIMTEHEATITGFYEGSWDVHAEDTETAWFIMDNGYWVRPSFVYKLASEDVEVV